MASVTNVDGSNPGPNIVTAKSDILGQGSPYQIGTSATSLVGFYGTTPIAQRSLAAQATSLVGTASSTALDTATKAALIEVMNTLAAMGVWKGSA